MSLTTVLRVEDPDEVAASVDLLVESFVLGMIGPERGTVVQSSVSPGAPEPSVRVPHASGSPRVVRCIEVEQCTSGPVAFSSLSLCAAVRLLDH